MAMRLSDEIPLSEEASDGPWRVPRRAGGGEPDWLLNWLERILRVIAEPGAVLNRERQVLLANQALRTWLGLDEHAELGRKRFGEAVGCLFAAQGRGGCGTSHHCAVCTARRLIGGESNASQVRFRHVPRQAGRPVTEFEIRMIRLPIAGQEYLLCTFQPIQGADPRASQERMFLHQVLSTASALVNTCQMLRECQPGDCTPEEETELKAILEEGAQQLLQEIRDRRQRLELETGELHTQYEEISLADLLRGLALTGPANLECAALEDDAGVARDQVFISDPVLLHRTLQRIIHDVAAMNTREPLRLFVRPQREELSFLLHFPVPLSRSLKALLMETVETGEGAGAPRLNARELVERGLHGKLEYMTREPLGTVVMITLPRRQLAAAE